MYRLFFLNEITGFRKAEAWHKIPTFEDWKNEILKDLEND